VIADIDEARRRRVDDVVDLEPRDLEQLVLPRRLLDREQREVHRRRQLARLRHRERAGLDRRGRRQVELDVGALKAIDAADQRHRGRRNYRGCSSTHVGAPWPRKMVNALPRESQETGP
jgi:hypothetical protein